MIANLSFYSDSEAFIDALDLEYVRDIELIKDKNSYYLNFVIDIANKSKNDIKLNDLRVGFSFDLDKEPDIYIGLSNINQLKIPSMQKTDGDPISINVAIEDIEQLHLDLISSNEIQSILTDYDPKIKVRLIGDFDIGVRSSMGWTYQNGLSIDWVIGNSLNRELLITTYKDIEKASDIDRDKGGSPIEKDFLIDEHLFRTAKTSALSFEEAGKKGVLERYVFDLLKFIKVEDVSKYLNINLIDIDNIKNKYQHKTLAKPKLKHLKKIAIRELHIGERRFVFIVDLITGAIIYKTSDDGDLKRFFANLKRSGVKIEAAFMDVYAQYYDVFRLHFPNGQIVYDRLQIIKCIDNMIEDYRSALFKENRKIFDDNIGHGDLWLKLKDVREKGNSNLDYSGMEIILNINKNLMEAYTMRDLLCYFWKQPSKKEADRFLYTWITIAKQSEIDLLNKMGTKLDDNRLSCANWYSHMISINPIDRYIY